MTNHDIIQVALFFLALIGLAPVLGNYMSNVFSGNKHFMLPLFGWLERITYKLAGINPHEETSWKSYTFALLLFNLIGFIFVFLLQLFQAYLTRSRGHAVRALQTNASAAKLAFNRKVA
jgi:K+-transporting ATPase, A chain